ncbi:P-loop containing nucleoside triphosphate hydrolase protein [Bisporella sp. PMI_857]|nr:P-loop containing nucleoside triphosphate hydrolase protein [Bisporella sp. PMI_857]
MNGHRSGGIFHKTSVDAAKATYTTISRAGQKRTFDEVRGKTLEPVSNQGPSINDTYKGDFQRPRLQDKLYPPLTAGGIIDVDPQGTTLYSQRKTLALTPNSTSNPLLDLAHPNYGLLQGLVNNFAALGVKSIYPWQSECLLRSGALGGKRNLVYTAPTGGGKSLVADILMLKKVIECPGKKALLVLPYVALVQEKMRWLRKLVDGLAKHRLSSPKRHSTIFRSLGNEDNLRVVGLFGGSKSKASWADMDIAVCTIEKANSLINSAIEEHTVDDIGAVVIDELHMIDDDNRGYILEVMATKLLTLEQGVQIIGMSATLNNAKQLAKWLNDARFYRSRYQPVPIEEHLVFDNNIYPAANSSKFYKTATELVKAQGSVAAHNPSQMKLQSSRIILPSPNKELSDALTNSVVSLAYETAWSGYGALVFCSSRAGCERDAILISQVMPRVEQTGLLIQEKRAELLADLRSTPTGLDSVMEKTVPVGVAFHHAGLTTEERDLIATAYDAGVIKVVVATCCLAAGINLPARRVILHGARMGADLVGPSMLRQMRGRAGRKGKDEIGETYHCCQKSDLEDVTELMEAEIPDVKSSLLPGKKGIKRALLEVIATKLATTTDSVGDYIKKTLLHCSAQDKEDLSINPYDLEEMVKSTLRDLEETSMIKKNGLELEATLLGHAIVASSLTPEDGLFVYRELTKALQAFVMDGEMHVLYTFTPVNAIRSAINWKVFLKEVEDFNESDTRALGFVGLSRTKISKMAQGGEMKESTLGEVETARVYKRFYAALQLRDLCNEMPIHAVARKYDLPRGIVQNLAQTCHGFAAGMIQFCQRMSWGALAAVLDHFSDRLKAGAKSDLLALAQISYIKSRTARVFWENGFKTVASIAAADPKDILPVLLQAQPKKLKVEGKEEKDYHGKLLTKAEYICKKANEIWEREMRMQLDEQDLE